MRTALDEHVQEQSPIPGRFRLSRGVKSSAKGEGVRGRSQVVKCLKSENGIGVRRH